MNTHILQSVRKIIVHGNCPDGRASAIILHDALPDAEVLEMSYSTKQHLELPAESGLLFCDFTPPRERVEEFVAVGAIVLDHHKGAEDIVRAFGERGVFADEVRDPGVSGATLAYLEVWLKSRWLPGGSHPEMVKRLGQLAGVRDTWQRHDKRWDDACALAAWLAFVPFEKLMSMDIATHLRMGESVGSVLLAKRRLDACAASECAVRKVIGGRRVAILPSVELVSDASDLIGDTADLVAGFAFEHESGGSGVRMKWSLRSRGHVDVSELAKRHGGGGHTRAAGFSWNGSGDPYEAAERLFGEVAA